MTNDELRTWVRIYAAEILTVNLYAISLLQTPNPLELLQETRRQMIDGARQQGFPGVDAAMLDLASAELEDAVDRLMQMVSGHINEVLKRRQSSAGS